jgi:asparagine synthase (glutamine-hydrolysing)
MCGITGVWTLQCFNEISERLSGMTDKLAHRGPDASGYWFDVDAGIAFGHRRLAIIGLGETGAQPMLSENGRYCLTYNGEIYNHLDLRKELAAHGKNAWRGQSDTETLLACFAQYGIEETVTRCVGMFAMAIWDRQTQELMLVRDRLGEKPLYYGFVDGAFTFGSELSAVIAGAKQKPELDHDALALFLHYGYIPQPYSAYRGVSKLPAGAVLRICREQIYRRQIPEPRMYWTPESFLDNDNVIQVPEHDAVSRLEELLEQSVKGQMLSEVPLGAFLSGGIDSSTIVALMQKHSIKPIKTFTVGFGDSRFNEAQHAKAVAVHLGTDHTELYVTDSDALAVIPKLSAIYSEPFADSSQIPTYLISALAGSQVKVGLSGDGGDELFLGYSRYPMLADYWRFMGVLPQGIRTVISDCLRWVPMGRWDQFFQLVRPLLSRTGYSSANGWRLYRIANMLRLNSPDACYREMMSHWDTRLNLIKGAHSLPHEMLAFFNPCARGLMKQAGLRDIKSYLPDDILVKIDRASMANSLETRVPLLDHRIVEFALSQPQSLHRRDGQSKWMLRQILHKHVPSAIINRPKMGFGVPLASWLRGPLKEWAGDLLSRESLLRIGMLEPNPILNLWRSHLESVTDGQYPLWNILMLLEWMENNSK